MMIVIRMLIVAAAILSIGVEASCRRMSANDYNERGMTHSERDQWDLAIVDFSEAIKLDPSESTYYFNRGSAYGSAGKFEESIADFNKAIELETDNKHLAQNYTNRGISNYALGRLDEAIADFSSAVELNPEEPKPYLQLGSIYDVRRQDAKAIAYYRKVLAFEAGISESDRRQLEARLKFLESVSR